MSTTSLGTGLYSVSTAARLVQMPPAMASRWLHGRTVRESDGEARRLPPVVTRSTEHVSFLDVVELRVVRAMLGAGLTMPKIRSASAYAASKLKATHHPFCQARFKTDGRSIFCDDGERLFDIRFGQMLIRDVMLPVLKDLRYDDIGLADRWWPLGKRKPLIVDPDLHMGEPVATSNAVPSRLLAGMVLEGGESLHRTAEWYGVTFAEVRAAVELERQMSGHRAAA